MGVLINNASDNYVEDARSMQLCSTVFNAFAASILLRLVKIILIRTACCGKPETVWQSAFSLLVYPFELGSILGKKKSPLVSFVCN